MNIRYHETNKWKGQIGESRGFCRFESPAYGIRATIKILRSYRKVLKDSFSISNIIARYAPVSDGNNTRAYIDYVAKYCAVWDVDSYYDIDDESNLYILLRAMCMVETNFVLEYSLFLKSLELL